VLSAYVESVYVSKNATLEQVFWSYHRYLCGAIAVWAAVTHQARDILDAGMYGMFGFTAGLLAYMVFLIKQGHPCRTNLHTCIVVWLGICAVVGTFVMAIQQHWYTRSTQRSSAASVVCLLISLCQCLFQTPYDIAPVALHVLLSLTVLCVSFWAAVVDTWEG
jgi:ABC-type transport system involved in cytochrome c biogenesis permease subunit